MNFLDRLKQDQTFTITLATVTLLHIFFSVWGPVSEDELYYWAWSKALSPSYFDHPPITAYSIALSRLIFGDTVFAIRLPAIVYSTGTVLLLFSLINQTWILSLALFTLIFFFGAILMTPDAPLLFFWAAYFVWTHRTVLKLQSSEKPNWKTWAIGGLLLGTGVLSKYTMLLSVGCSFAAMLCNLPLRKWWKGYLLHGVVALFSITPILIFNFQHEFIPLLFQWNHIQTAYGYTFKRFIEFWGWQAVIVGFLPCFLLFFAVFKVFKTKKVSTAFTFFILPASYFIYKSLTVSLEGNWAFVTYISVWVLADEILPKNFSLLQRAGILLSFVPAWLATLALIWISVYPLPFIPTGKDRVRISEARLGMAREATATLRERNDGIPFYAGNYQWTSLFRFAGTPAIQLPIHRPSHFTITNKRNICEDEKVYFWSSQSSPIPSELSCFSKQEKVATFKLVVSGQELEQISILKFER